MNEHITTTTQERLKERELIEGAVAMARPLLQNSHLLEGNSGTIDPGDVNIVKDILQRVFPVDVSNYRTHAHLQLAARFGQIFAERVGLNSAEIQVLMLGHDVGRFITHRWLRNELVAAHALNALGVRKDLLKKAPINDSRPPEDVSDAAVKAYFDNMGTEQRIVTIADICGKRNFDDWGIRTFDEVMQYHRRQRAGEGVVAMQNTTASFPSERRIRNEMIEFTAILYDLIRQWLSDEGVDVEEVRRMIIEEESSTSVRTVILDTPSPTTSTATPLAHASGEHKYDVVNINELDM
ncbi:MAG TPA: hypothetical protein PKJ68_05920, partial [Candidatus Woesebacteria bacterium]|nr:hypothetical protein [Candidatus Woesebacteria bacterium]